MRSTAFWASFYPGSPRDGASSRDPGGDGLPAAPFSCHSSHCEFRHASRGRCVRAR